MFVCAQQQQQQACAFSVNIEQTRRSSRLLNYRPERRFDPSARVCRRLGTERSDLRLTILTQGRPRAEQSYISLARRREIYATHLTFIRGVHILKYICVEASFNETSWCLLLHLTESLQSRIVALMSCVFSFFFRISVSFPSQLLSMRTFLSRYLSSAFDSLIFQLSVEGIIREQQEKREQISVLYSRKLQPQLKNIWFFTQYLTSIAALTQKSVKYVSNPSDILLKGQFNILENTFVNPLVEYEIRRSTPHLCLRVNNLMMS